MEGRRVLIVGAGLAGLAAAHELRRGGAVVTIVEARERAGGRVWTVRDGFAAGQHAELGGEFIDAEHHRMRGLVNRFGLPLVGVLAGGFTHRYRPPGGAPKVTRSGAWNALCAAFAPLVRSFRAAHGDVESPAIREI